MVSKIKREKERLLENIKRYEEGNISPEECVWINDGLETNDVHMELDINLTDKKGTYIGQKYSIIFERKEIEKLVNYIKNITEKN